MTHPIPVHVLAQLKRLDQLAHEAKKEELAYRAKGDMEKALKARKTYFQHVDKWRELLKPISDTVIASIEKKQENTQGE